MKTLILLLCCCCSLFALPQCPIITGGKAQIHREGNRLMIQAEDRTVLEWEEFSIASGETVDFELPTPDSMILNRIYTSSPSAISGSMRSNGQILLINAAGFRNDGEVDAGGFVASAFDTCDCGFLAREPLSFWGESREPVQNFGTIRAMSGNALLIGHNVANHGMLTAPAGLKAALIAEEIVLMNVTR